MPTHPTPMLDEVRSIPQKGMRAKARPVAPAPVLAIRIPLRLVGLMTLGLVAVCLVSLASWSVDDPSFSYATSKAPANWLGFPGAALADILRTCYLPRRVREPEQGTRSCVWARLNLFLVLSTACTRVQ